MYKNQETISCTAKGKLEGDEIIVYCFKVTKPISYVSSAIGKLYGRNEGVFTRYYFWILLFLIENANKHNKSM